MRHPQAGKATHQEWLFAAAAVYAPSHPHDSLANVLMRCLMVTFVGKDPTAGNSMLDRMRVTDGGINPGRNAP